MRGEERVVSAEALEATRRDHVGDGLVNRIDWDLTDPNCIRVVTAVPDLGIHRTRGIVRSLLQAGRVQFVRDSNLNVWVECDVGQPAGEGARQLIRFEYRPLKWRN